MMGAPYGTGFRASHGAASRPHHTASIPSASAPFEGVVHDLWRDSNLVAFAGPTLLRANEELIREARDNLSDALAKLEDAICL